MLSIFKTIKTYLETKYTIARLDVTEKIILVIGLLLQIIIVLMLLSVILFFLSLALANFLGNYWNDTSLGFLTVTGLYILILLIFIIFRKPILINPLNKTLIRLLLNQHKEETDEEEENDI